MGVPLTPKPDGSGGDPMEVERWPLVQAYGAEGVGRPGFFSLNFQVVDVGQVSGYGGSQMAGGF